MSRELIVGPDATNATEQLDDLVGDDILFDRLSDLASRDASANVWDDTDVQARLAELGIQLPADAPAAPGTNAEPDPATAEPAVDPAAQQPVQESRTKELAMDLEDPLMSDEEFETKYGDSREAMQGRAGRVQDRRSGEWYDPAEKFDQLKNSPEFQSQMQRMARREGMAEGDAPIDFDWYRKQQQRQTQAKQKPGVAESYPKHQDLSGISTEKLKAYLAKQSQQQVSGEGNQVKRVRAELQRRSQGVTETNVEKYKDLGATDQTTHFIKNVTTGKIVSPHRSLADAENALVGNERNSNDQFKIVRARKPGMAEGVDPATYPARAQEAHEKYLKYENMVDQELRKLGQRLPQSWDAARMHQKLSSDAKYALALKYYDLSEKFASLSIRYEELAKKRGMAESLLDEFVEGLNGDELAEDAVDDFLARGGEIQQGKFRKPRKSEKTDYGSRHIGGMRDAVAGKGGKTLGKAAATNFMGGGKAVVGEGDCNHTMEGEMCPEHGLTECGMHESQVAESQGGAALLARIKSLALLR
jgi:hypothetical protein